MYEEIKTAALYMRYSSHAQTEQSIEGQERECKRFCNDHHIKIVAKYIDRALSGKKSENRIEFQKMIKDSEKRKFDAVIVYKLDRFARSRYDSANYKFKLKKNGVQLISAMETITDNPEGVILESVLEGMAEYYSLDLSQKVSRGMRESALKHNSIGGALPLGYKIEGKKYVIDERTAPIVKEAFERYANGERVSDITRSFNEKGYTTSKGAKFSRTSFAKMFTNERYIGVYKYGEYRAEGEFPVIIDRDTWEKVQILKKKNKQASGHAKAKELYILSGKLFCGHCGSIMNGNSNTKNHYYNCRAKRVNRLDCSKHGVRKELIENAVVQDALSMLTDERIEEIATICYEQCKLEMEQSSVLASLKNSLVDKEKRIANLMKIAELGDTPDIILDRIKELTREKKEITKQIVLEEKSHPMLEKEQVIFWLEQFRNGKFKDIFFQQNLIDLFVNSVTVWDIDKDNLQVVITYNLSSMHDKTYRLDSNGRLLDFDSTGIPLEPHTTLILDKVLIHSFIVSS